MQEILLNQMDNLEVKTAPKEKNKSAFWETVRYAAIALIIIIPFRIFVAQPYVVSGSSMDPTFKDGDYLIVDQLSKRFEEPERGSVVIIRYPRDPSKFFIKRLVAFPNEKVEIKNGIVKIFNKENPEGIEIDDSYVTYKKSDNFSAQLYDDEYFVMGDNRAGSSDSRVWGSLPKKNIVGRPILRLLPINKLDIWPGVYE
jgi:signal peptidase I